MVSKILQFVKSHTDTLLLCLIIFLVSVISFQIGRAWTPQTAPLKITQGATIYNAGSGQSTTNPQAGESAKEIKSTLKPVPTDLRVVASKNSDKYHYLWCSGANRIKEANRVYFVSAKEAEADGRTLAANCTAY